MRVHLIGHVEKSAEGDCLGFPYDTELVSSQGVSILFWIGDRDFKDPDVKDELTQALGVARNHRDIVRAYACPGQPTKYWARQNIPDAFF